MTDPADADVRSRDLDDSTIAAGPHAMARAVTHGRDVDIGRSQPDRSKGMQSGEQGLAIVVGQLRQLTRRCDREEQLSNSSLPKGRASR